MAAQCGWSSFPPSVPCPACLVFWVTGLSDPKILFPIAVSRVLALDMMIGAFFNMT